MRKIRIGFSKPKDKWLPIFSWAIRLYEGTPYSHVYIRWQTKWNTWLCYHAASVMIHFLGESSFAKHLTIVEEFEFEITDAQFDRLMAFCTKYVGEDYALFEVLMIPVWDFLSARGQTVPTLANSTNKQYCAELVMRALAEMNGENLTFDVDRVKLKYVYDFVKNKFESGAKV